MSKKAAFEMAKKYYPLLWSPNRLLSLVKNHKLTKEEFKEITGKEFSE